jgi:flagellar biosynthesis protein FlhF
LAIARRLKPAPIDLEKAHGILLVGPRGAGKSAVAAKIAHAATLAGRTVEITRADGGLALFRTNSHAPDRLTVMEADGFNPLNARAASAFRALGEIEGVETIGLVSALNDAEDVSDLVSTFRFHRVIVTHMDLTRRLGATLAAAIGGAQLAHVTHGPHPEDGLDMLSPDAVAAQMLESEFHQKR